MATSGKWLGQHVGGWLGAVDGGGDPGPTTYIDAALQVSGLGSATLAATISMFQELKPTGGGKARARLAYPAAVLRPRPFRPAQPTVDMAALRRAEEDALLLTACL